MKVTTLLAVLLVGCTPITPSPDPGDPPPGDPENVEPSGTLDVEPPPADSPHLQLGVPVDATPDDDLLIVHEQFALSYSRYLNVPSWVSWRTRGVDFGPVDRYDGPFYPDDALPADVWHPDTGVYSGSGYDRGHMLRSEERTRTEGENYQTFVLTNVLPQRPDLNRGVWFDFERYVQRRVQSSQYPKDAYVIAGGIWPAACATHAPRVAGDGCIDIGHGSNPTYRIAVPEATWKVVVFVPAGTPLEEAEEPYVVAVIMPNIGGIENDRWYEYRTTVAEIEQRTGYDIPRLE
jgi:endonuclease G